MVVLRLPLKDCPSLYDLQVKVKGKQTIQTMKLEFGFGSIVCEFYKIDKDRWTVPIGLSKDAMPLLLEDAGYTLFHILVEGEGIEATHFDVSYKPAGFHINLAPHSVNYPSLYGVLDYAHGLAGIQHNTRHYNVAHWKHMFGDKADLSRCTPENYLILLESLAYQIVCYWYIQRVTWDTDTVRFSCKFVRDFDAVQKRHNIYHYEDICLPLSWFTYPLHSLNDKVQPWDYLPEPSRATKARERCKEVLPKDVYRRLEHQGFLGEYYETKQLALFLSHWAFFQYYRLGGLFETRILPRKAKANKSLFI